MKIELLPGGNLIFLDERLYLSRTEAIELADRLPGLISQMPVHLDAKPVERAKPNDLTKTLIDIARAAHPDINKG